MNNNVLVSVKNLSRYYGKQLGIKNISFDACRGEIVGLLGVNGAGKSTTMQIISGILAPSSGSVSIADLNIKEHPLKTKQHIGFLPENPPLYLDLTVDEYLQYLARIRRVRKNKLSAAISISKKRCGLESVGDRLINNLSKGYRQRVGIAQAIIHSPSIIILDEPTSGLDPVQINEIRCLMLELAKEHCIIFSTHILSEVQSLCDRVLIIEQGGISLDKPLNKLQDDTIYESIEICLHNPPNLEDIKAIKNVTAVKNINEKTFHITCNSNTDVTDKIVEKSYKNKWGLYKLNQKDSSLESVFLNLTKNNSLK